MLSAALGTSFSFLLQATAINNRQIANNAFFPLRISNLFQGKYCQFF
jgi:hypothetical protein